MAHKTLCPIIFCILVSNFLFIQCDHPQGSIERNHPLDPLSENYVPEVIGSIDYMIDSTGNITLNWLRPGRLKEITGYIIQKGDFSESENLIAELTFEEISRVPPDSLSFKDTSKEFSSSTAYRVSPYFEVDGVSYILFHMQRKLMPEAKITAFNLYEPENSDIVQFTWEVFTFFDLLEVHLHISGQKLITSEELAATYFTTRTELRELVSSSYHWVRLYVTTKGEGNVPVYDRSLDTKDVIIDLR